MQITNKRTVVKGLTAIASLLLCFAGEANAKYGSSSPQARALAEKFLEYSGGRDAWKSPRSIHVLSVSRSSDQLTPYLFEFWIDFERPRMLTRVRGQTMNRLRSLNGKSGWSVKEGTAENVLTEFTPARLLQEITIWQGAYTRNIWRLATEDPNLIVKVSDNNRLEFYNKDGSLTAWLRIAADGRAMILGFPFDMQQGTEFATFENYGIYKLPMEGRSTDGGFSFETILVDVSKGSPPDSFFEPPVNLRELDRKYP